MGWTEIMALAIGVPAALFPTVFVWSIVGGGAVSVARARKTAKAPLTCSIDNDCPPGYVCRDGRCERA